MFEFEKSELFAEGVAVARIADAVGTPFFLYSAAHFRARYEALSEAFQTLSPKIHYAIKANSNQSVIRTFAGIGAGADVVSVGELERALAAGVRATDIVYSGVGKTDAEIVRGIEVGVGQFNVESFGEIRAIARLAKKLGREQRIAIRVNPDVDAGTHEKITTGTADNKFGIDAARVGEAAALARDCGHLNLVGLAVHIGSQITDMAPFRRAFTHILNLAQGLNRDGFAITRIDLGGGLGVGYRGDEAPSLVSYAAMIEDIFAGESFQIILEPGRFLTANGGLLVASVIGVKRRGAKNFLVLDAGMNDLHRPSLYDAWHRIEPVNQQPGAELALIDVVGPICETGDTFARDRLLPPLGHGELVAIHSAGAYGAVMASNYNSRGLAAEVLVEGKRFALVRRAQSIDDLIGADLAPDWQGSSE